MFYKYTKYESRKLVQKVFYVVISGFKISLKNINSVRAVNKAQNLSFGKKWFLGPSYQYKKLGDLCMRSL